MALPCIIGTEFAVITETYFTMRDGVNLYTRIIVPRGKTSCPTVLYRHPYGNGSNGRSTDGWETEYDQDPFIQHGYAIVEQHCRGTGNSEGIFSPYEERNDGLDTLDGIRQLPTYNGDIFLNGGSYPSAAHLSYLGTNPPDIKGAVLCIQTDRLETRYKRNGCPIGDFDLSFHLWKLERQYRNIKRDGAFVRPYADTMKRAIGSDYKPYTQNLTGETPAYEMENAVDRLNVPVLMADGWYDSDLSGMFSMWQRLPEKTRNRSVFVVGPWGHATSTQDAGNEYPLPNGNIPRDFTVEWFDSIRQHRGFRYGTAGMVLYYSVGSDKWESGVYPGKNGSIKLFFGKGGKLVREPQKEEKITYTYDPEKRHGAFRYGTVRRAARVGCDGILSFVSAPTKKTEQFYGSFRWRMKVMSDREDTAFFMRVHFVENGEAYNLTETITSLTNVKPDYKAGEETVIDLVTPPIAFTLKAGNSIRVDISSDGTAYLPHTNTGEPWYTATETKAAHNTVFIGESYIELI